MLFLKCLYYKVSLGRHLDEISVKLEEHIDSLLRVEVSKPERMSSTIQQLLDQKVEITNLELEGSSVVNIIYHVVGIPN